MNPATEVVLDLCRSGQIDGAEALGLLVAIEAREADLAVLAPYESEFS